MNTFVKFLVSVVALSMGLYSASAHARPCPRNAKTQILNGLEARSCEASLGPNETEEEAELRSEEATYLSSVVLHSKKFECSYQSGIAGAVYELETDTHRIHLSFAGSRITSVSAEKLRAQ